MKRSKKSGSPLRALKRPAAWIAAGILGAGAAALLARIAAGALEGSEAFEERIFWVSLAINAAGGLIAGGFSALLSRDRSPLSVLAGSVSAALIFLIAGAASGGIGAASWETALRVALTAFPAFFAAAAARRASKGSGRRGRRRKSS